MAAIWRAEWVNKSKKEVQFFDSKQEAMDKLMEVYAREAIETIPHNGAFRIKAYQDSVPKYLEKLETIDDNISEWTPPHKK